MAIEMSVMNLPVENFASRTLELMTELVGFNLVKIIPT